MTKVEHERDEDRRADPEVQVRGEVDVRAARPGPAGVVRDLGQHAVERGDQEVHAEARRDAGEGRRDARPADVRPTLRKATAPSGISTR